MGLAVVFWAIASTNSHAIATWQGTATKDAFLATGSPGNPLGTDLSANNYGGAGTLAIAPATSTKGEFQSVAMFNLAPAASTFNTAYPGGWQITGITLTLVSNFGVQGVQPNNTIFNTINTGDFVIEWLADDSWVEGAGNPNAPSLTGVNYDSLGTLLASSHEVLGTYTYVLPATAFPLPGRSIFPVDSWPTPCHWEMSASFFAQPMATT